MADRGVSEDEAANTTDTVVDGQKRKPRTEGLPPTIERYRILAKLGEGGMGTVYAAHDSVLDRKVALKVVRADRRHAAVVSPDDQLLREAQAMARLAHPNVVTVYEVGEIGESVYLVIEFVDGTTLDHWIKERKRTWQEIVAAYVQAGRGLAAAHEAGLVHRDVKPQNILVRRDGRIQVTDFGVVSMSGSSSDSSESISHSGSSSVREITYAGRRVGTPSYMAPEQHTGDPVDARADQFSFAVALWEALFGVRPFAGSGERLAEIRAGNIVPPRATTDVPKFVEAVLRRALAADAANRWPSIESMLDALVHDPARARRRRFAIGAGTAGIAAIAIAGVVGWTRDNAAPEPCAGVELKLAGRWDKERAATVRASFETDTRAYEKTTGGRIVADIDAWSRRWVVMRRDACRATRVTGVQSEALLDARMHCLDRQLDEVAQLASALSQDRGALARTMQLPLPDLAVCADRDAVMARVPPAASPIQPQVLHLERELASVNAIGHTGRYREARIQATRVATEAVTLGFAPLTAEALLVRGRLEEQDGDQTAARESLAEAARVAAIAHDDRTQARALLSLVRVLLANQELTEALALSIAATAAVERMEDPNFDAELAEQLGAVHLAKGDDAAETYLARALSLREAAGRDSLAVAQVLNKLAALWLGSGRTADARAAYERALKIAIAELGDQHPATAIARANVCFLDFEAGKHAEARACQEQVLVTLEAALGEKHPQVAWALNEVALVQRDQGDSAGATKRFERALAIWERASGPDHPDVAWPLINLGEIANALGDHPKAAASCGRARALLDQPKLDQRDAIPALVCLAEAKLPRAPREAVTVAKRAYELAAATPGAADTALLYARCQVAAGDRHGAISTARSALAKAEGESGAKLTAWLRTHGVK